MTPAVTKDQRIKQLEKALALTLEMLGDVQKRHAEVVSERNQVVALLLARGRVA